MNQFENGEKGPLLQMQTSYLPLESLNEKFIWVLRIPYSFFNLLQVKLEKYNPPLGALRKRLVCDFHSIFYIDTNKVIWKKAKENSIDTFGLIYAEKQINCLQIIRSITDWMSAEFNFTFDIYEKDLCWEKICLEEKYTEGPSYNFLPAYFHHEFSKNIHIIDGINMNQALHFQHVLHDDGSSSCVSELIWASVYFGGKKETDLIKSLEMLDSSDDQKISLPYSLEIKTSLISVPFEEPNARFINIKSNIKRFVYWSIKEDMEKKVNLLYFPQPRYEYGEKQAGIEINLARKNGGIYVSTATEKDLLSNIDNLEELIDNPILFLKQQNLLPVFNNLYFSGENMLVEAGLGLQERNKVFLQVSEFFGFKPRPVLTKVSKNASRKQLPMFTNQSSKSIDIEVWDDNEKTLFNRIPTDFLYWEDKNTDRLTDSREFSLEEQDWLLNTQEKNTKGKASYPYKGMLVKDEALLPETLSSIKEYYQSQNKIKAFFISFQSSRDDQPHTCWIITASFELQLNFWYKSNEKICALLPEDKNVRNQYKTHLATMIKQNSNVGNGVLVNIDHYHEKARAIRNRDPKSTIRTCFGSIGKVNQFINGYKKLYTHHATISAIQDLLKDLEVFPEKAFAFWDNNQIWLGFDYINLSIGKRKQKIVVVSLLEKGQHVKYTILEDHSLDWISYSEMLKLLTNSTMLEKKFGKLNIKQDLVFELQKNKFFKILGELNQEEKQYYLVFKTALRNYFPKFFGFLTNQRASQKTRPTSLKCSENISFIRYNSTTEVPEGDVIELKKGSPMVTRGSGLFSDQSGFLFYSVGAKMDNMQTKLDLTKEELMNKLIARQQPREFLIMWEDKLEKRIEIANLCHSMRNSLLTSKQEVSEALCISYINSFNKYF
jgi:hypothetical protein